MTKIEKISIYELNPRFFKDYSGNGIGDILGIIHKFEYFKFLSIDAITLQDIFFYPKVNKNKLLFTLLEEVGNEQQMKLLREYPKKEGIKIFVEIKIKEMNISEDFLLEFIDTIKFWNNLGILGFVFKDFEFFKSEKEEMMTSVTLKNLRKLYTIIKEINDDIVVIGKSSIIELNDISLYTKGSIKVFDYFQSEKIPFFDISKKYGTNVMNKFNHKELVSNLKYYFDFSNILSFGNEKIGRVVSRWGNEGQFHKESAKSLAILSSFTPSSFTIYCGDELGSRNIGLTHLDDFQDKDFKQKKYNAIDMNISNKDFLDAQVMLSPINARSLMMWNDQKNGGFSTSNKTITPLSIHYSENNVEKQFANKYSVLNFYKKINKTIHDPYYREIFEHGKWIIKSKFKLIKMIFKLNKKELTIIVNLSNFNKKIKHRSKLSKGKIIFSSYEKKEYNVFPKILNPYESIVVIKDSLKNI